MLSWCPIQKLYVCVNFVWRSIVHLDWFTQICTWCKIRWHVYNFPPSEKRWKLLQNDGANFLLVRFSGIDDAPENPQAPAASTSIISRIKSRTKNRIQHSRNTQDRNSDLVEFVDMSQMGLHGTPTSINCPVCGATLADQKNYDIHKMFHH